MIKCPEGPISTTGLGCPEIAEHLEQKSPEQISELFFGLNQRHAAIWGGGSLAPVMNATASDIV